MAVSNRLQINLVAQDDISEQIKRTKTNIKSLKADVVDLARRQEAGEQGVQDQLEQTRRELVRNQSELVDLGRKASSLRREYSQLGSESVEQSRRATRAFDAVSRKLGLTGTAVDKVRSKMERLDDGADDFQRKWSRAFDKVESKSRSADRQMSKAGKSGGFMAAGFGKVAGVAAAATAAIAGLSGAFSFLSSSVTEARDARLAASQLAAVMRSMGRTESPKAIMRMVAGLEEMSGIDGDQILGELTNTMLTFGNVTGETFTKANGLALDLSVAFGKDLRSSSVMVGKALNDPIKGLTALSRIGVQFTAQQQDQVKAMVAVGDVAGAQKIILRELTRQVGGSAKAQADGIAKTAVAWGNLKEAVGDVLMSVTSGTGMDPAGVLKSMTKWIKKHKGEIVSFLQEIGGAVFRLTSIFLKWQSIVLKAFSVVVAGIAKVLEWMAFLDPSLKGVAEGAKNTADGLGDAAKAAGDASEQFRLMSLKLHGAAQDGKRLTDRLDAVGVAVDKLNQKQVKNLLQDTGIPGVNRQGGQVPGRFAGGPVWPGQPFMVGELGPEVFAPKVGPLRVIGADGPEVVRFPSSGTVIPNHIVTAGATSTVSRERVVERTSVGGVSVGQMVVRDEREAVRELQRMQDRQRRLERERR